MDNDEIKTLAMYLARALSRQRVEITVDSRAVARAVRDGEKRLRHGGGISGGTVTATTSTTWNGPVCATCHRGYIGAHTCSVDDMRAIIARLEAKIAELEAS